MKYKTVGYVMPLTFMLLATIVAFITALYFAASVYIPYQRTMLAQEKVRLLANGGISIAMAQLAQTYEPKNENKNDKEKQAAQKKDQKNTDEQDALFLAHFLSTFATWQTFTFTKARDGITGTVKICITSEDGKINLNKLYDFKQHRFFDQFTWSLATRELLPILQKATGQTINFFVLLENFLKKRQTPLNDISELFVIKEFSFFKDHLFYQPSPEKQGEQKSVPLYLADLFTTHSESTKINPWLLSPSIVTLLGLSRTAVTGKKWSTIHKGPLKDFKKNGSLRTLWNTTLSKIYGKQLQSLPKTIESMLSTSFEPRVFCVMVHAQIGSVIQRLVAILERRRDTTSTNQATYTVTIKRLYCI